MTIEYVPLSQFSDYHKRGWRVCPGCDFKAGDWTFVMQSPDHERVRRNNQSAGQISARSFRGPRASAKAKEMA